MDFTHNSLADGTTFRVMILIDPYSRECLAAVACRSFSGADVASVVAVAGIDRGALPKKIRVDLPPCPPNDRSSSARTRLKPDRPSPTAPAALSGATAC